MKKSEHYLMTLNRFAEKILAHLFWLLFVCEILSPMVGGRTFYLQYLIVVINPFFWVWFSRLNFKREHLLLTLIAVVLVPFYTVTAVKFLVIGLGVAFMVYCYQRELFFLRFYLAISVLFAAIQFYLVMTNSPLAPLFGPNNLSLLVWGSHATQTFTNFYTIFYFPRVSGLSREAGFFASLVIGSYFAHKVNAGINGFGISRRNAFTHYLGYFFSFSKISLVVVIAFVAFALRRVVDRIPLAIIGSLFVVALVLFWNHFQAVLLIPGNGTYLGRFGGYTILDQLTFWQLILGVSDIKAISGPTAYYISTLGYQHLYGLGGWIISNGVLGFVLYMIGLYALGIRGSGFLFILMMTATVGIDTNQNFCVLAYYVAFMLPKARTVFSRVPEKPRRQIFRWSRTPAYMAR